MKKQINEHGRQTEKSKEDGLSNRRKLLGTFCGGAAVAIWHKPFINSVIIPSHAQTSTAPGPVTTTGSTSGAAIPDQMTININLPLAHPNGTPPTVSKVVLELDITHPFQGDIIVSLTSPSGTSSVLINRIGTGNTTFGCSNADFMVTLDDDASSTLPSDLGDCPAAALTGTFSSGGGLTAFNGESANGTWVLTIEDAAATDGGMLNQAMLSVTCA